MHIIMMYITYLYSGTSDCGPSKEKTTSEQRDKLKPCILLPLRKGQPLYRGERIGPKLSLVERLHCSESDVHTRVSDRIFGLGGGDYVQ